MRLPGGLRKLRSLLQRGLEETAALWPPVRVAYRWVKRVARLLENKAALPVAAVDGGVCGRLLTQIRQAAAAAATPVRSQLEHFVKVTQSYRRGLFWLLRGGGPATDEQRSGTLVWQSQVSRTTGERPSPCRTRFGGDGVRRLVAGLATRLRPEALLELPGDYVAEWRRLRAELEQRREARRQQGRFRRDPVKYLNKLEELLLQLSLPS